MSDARRRFGCFASLALVLLAQGVLAQVTAPASSGAGGAIVKRATREDADHAYAALQELTRAYEARNLALLQGRLDSAMVGYQRIIDGVAAQGGLQRATRVIYTDTQITAGPDVAVVQTAWEKRAVASRSFTPQLWLGRVTFLLKRISANEELKGRTSDRWRITAIDGDNPFFDMAPVGRGGVTQPLAHINASMTTVALASLPNTCAGVPVLPSQTTPVSGSLTGIVTWQPGATTASGSLSGTLSGARIGTVNLSNIIFNGAVTPLRETALRPTTAQSINVSIALTGSVSGPANGPFTITANGDANAGFSYTDPRGALMVTDTLTGMLTGPLTISPTKPAIGLLSGDVTGRLVGTLKIGDTPITSTTPNAPASIPIRTTRVTVAVGGSVSGPAAGPLSGNVSGSIVLTPFDTQSPSSVTISVSARVTAPGTVFPPLTATVTGAVTATATVAPPPVPCVAIPVMLEVLDAAAAGRGPVTVVVTTSQGDTESLTLNEASPGRFVALGLPMARAGGVRVRDNLIEVIDPGAIVTVTYTAQTGQTALVSMRLQ